VLCITVFSDQVPSLGDDSSVVTYECGQDECGTDRSLLLQLPTVIVDSSALDADYPDSEILIKKGELEPDGNQLPNGIVGDWKDDLKQIMKDMKMHTNSQGDLAAFMSSICLDTISFAMLIGFFCLVYRRYPLVYMDNINLGLAAKFEETCFGWVSAAWNLTSQDIEDAAGLDAAMFMEFVQLSIRLMLTIGIPMVLILCPLHVYAGGHGAGTDNLSQLGMANVVSGEGARWVYWIHAIFVWYVVVMTQRAIFLAQESFLEKRQRWLRQMPRPRSTTVLVEGIPADTCNDSALKEEFNKLFPGGRVLSAFVVKNVANLTSLIDAHRSATHSLDKANFEWETAGGTEDVRPRCRNWPFGEMVDKIDLYEQKKKEIATRVLEERQFLADPKNSAQVYANSGFVTFATEREAAIALALKVRADEYEFAMSIPPDPADVIYSDLYMDQSTLQIKSFIGYVSIVAVFFGFTPIILAISSIINLTALRRSIPLVEKLIQAVPMSERLLEGVLASAALTLFMSFLPTIFMFIFDSFYQLKAGRWAQHSLQIWYFWFQVIFVLLITAVGSSLWDTVVTLISHPTLIFELLAHRLPSTTHFYLNFMAMQWAVHGLNLTRYINLSKYKALLLVCDEQQAKDMSEPEDQDYYGMGARSARFTLNLVIALVYCSLCPLITVITGINFVICKVVYGYLLVFAEMPKPDLGGVFWVSQLRHAQHGLFIYIMLMIGVLSSRAATLGPTIVAAPALLYCMRNFDRFQYHFQWETLPFEEIAKQQQAPDRARKVPSRQKSLVSKSSKSDIIDRTVSGGSLSSEYDSQVYEQPELTKPSISTQ
jgi:hypothetical protein